MRQSKWKRVNTMTKATKRRKKQNEKVLKVLNEIWGQTQKPVYIKDLVPITHMSTNTVSNTLQRLKPSGKVICCGVRSGYKPSNSSHFIPSFAELEEVQNLYDLKHSPSEFYAFQESRGWKTRNGRPLTLKNWASSYIGWCAQSDRQQKQLSMEIESKGENITISTVLPKDIVKHMKVKAAQEDKTIRVIILEALAKKGFTVDPAELVDKRTKPVSEKKNTVTSLINQLAHDLVSRSDDFVCGDNYIKDKRSGYVFNLGGLYRGCAGIGVPFELEFNFYDRWRFLRTVKQWKKQQALKALGELK